MSIASEFVTDVYLVSAYDIHYGDVQDGANLPMTPEIIFLDSGGYEKSTDRDYSDVVDSLPAPNQWDIDKLSTVLDAWPNEVPAVFVSFDEEEERKPFAQQVKDARELFKNRLHLNLILLKPETRDQKTLSETIKVAMASAERLGGFDIIGVTEKELGNRMIDRMSQISNLRLSLDAAGVKSPIHVFGALDPLSVCLYFVAGAEIFDGLTAIAQYWWTPAEY